MNHVICNQAGTLEKCKTCPAAKPHSQRMGCPYGLVVSGITKFMGFLRKEDGKWFVTLNGKPVPTKLIQDSPLNVKANLNKRMIFWVTDHGIETYRIPYHESKIH